MSERFDMAVTDAKTRRTLQQVEQRHGTHKVQRWADEGMKAEIMGLPPYMEEFRERQAERSEEIPYDIERRNKHSEQRSEEAVQRMGPAGETGVPDSVRDVISSSGQTLDANIQRAMEERIGDSLGDVRVHTGPKAAGACEDINARAFTVGNHVAFNSGEYDPESPEGQHVLAHELAHVRQQTGGAVSMLPQEDVELEIDPDPALEREAEETAQRVMEGGELGIQRMRKTEVHVQRMGAGVFAHWARTGEGPIDQLRNEASDAAQAGKERIAEATTKTYRLTREKLVELAETVDSAAELPQFIDEHDIDAASKLQDTMSSGPGMAMKARRVGSAVGTAVGGPAGYAVGGILGMPIGYFFAKKAGGELTDKVQKKLRSLLDLNNDQEFNQADENTGNSSLLDKVSGF